jgi:putative addiction module component (TIGR02574 family)
MAKPDLDIRALSPDERLDLIERLWESLEADEDAIPLTDEQRSELDRRLTSTEHAESNAVTPEQMREQVRRATS